MSLKRLLAVLMFVLTASAVFSSAAISREWNVIDAGAVPDGVTDNTAIFQKLLDEAGKAGGGVVIVPTGRFAIKGNLSIPAFVTLQGTYKIPPLGGPSAPAEPWGSMLLAYAGRGSQDGEPFIRLKGSASAVSGLIISYPEWKQTDVPPVPYPPCIMCEHADNVAVTDCNILNAYEAIRFVWAGRHYIRNVYGYPIWRGIFVDECYDIGRIENIHFWPFGVNYKPDDPYCKWINTNGTAFQINRSDWQYVTNTFCFGYGVGYKFSEDKHGGCNGNFLGIGADSCERAVLVEQAQGPGLLITNGEFVGRWSSKSAVAMEIGEKVGGKVSLNNCSFWGPLDKCVWQRGPNSQFTASACNFLDWNVNKNGSPAIAVDAGRTILQGNTFREGELHIKLADKVQSAIIMGNQASGGLVVKNACGKRCIELGNETSRVEWTREKRSYYRINIGSGGDSKYVKNWHGQESGLEWSKTSTKRWSAPNAQLILPVNPGKAYNVTMEVYVPEHAVQSDAGIYLGNKLIAKIAKAGKITATGTVAASKSDQVILSVRCKNWQPSEKISGNTDNRILGIAGISVTMREKGAKAKKPFSVNSGEWVR